MNTVAANISSSQGQFSKTSVFAMSDFSSSPTRLSTGGGSYGTGGSQFKKMNRFFKKSPYLPFIIVAIIVIAIAGIFFMRIARNQQTSQVAGASARNTQTQISVAKPLAQETLNKSFDFPLKDATGKKISKFTYEIQSAELDNQIIIKGQIATAVQGRAFLVLNLKITNSYDKDVELNTRDFVRLIVNNSSDKLAADIHNDPVDVQAISTKFTKIGFPIDLNAKNLKLEVGEIDGPKQSIPLNLQ